MNCKIKKFLAVLLALAFAQNSFAAGENNFRAGVSAYETGEFERAARSFRDSLAEQTAAGTLLNLGLAEWREDENGEAILAWEQAQWLNPLDHEARENLSYARETAQINPLELNGCEQVSVWLPANFWTWLASGSLWLAIALMILPGFFRMKKAGWHQTVAALMFGIFLLSLAPSIGIFTRAKIGIVTEKNTSLRLTPTQSAELVASLPPGESVRELRQRGNYFFVHTQSGNGWIERQQIKFICPK